MIVLEATRLSWVSDDDDALWDQCAHGTVDFRVNEHVYVRPEDGSWTLSAAGLFLLRSLEFDHGKDFTVSGGNLMFPCCGHSVWAISNGPFGVMAMGCNNGVDVTVAHRSGTVHIGTQAGHTEAVNLDEWKQAVKSFTRDIRAFYTSQPPRTPPDDDEVRRGWEMFWEEWKSRYDTL